MAANFLVEKYERDKNTIAINGIRGFDLNEYNSIAEKIHGVQAGMITIIAEANVGKTLFLTSLTLDLLFSNENLKILFFTFDDSKSDIIDNFLANITGISKNKVNCNWNRTKEEDDLILSAYKKIDSYFKKGLLDIKTYEDINNLDSFKDCVRKNKELYNNLVVCIDGIALLNTQFLDDNKSEALKSKELKRMYNQMSIPIILTLEMAKGDFHRPNKNSGKGTGRYAYDSKLVFCLSEVDELYKEQKCYPAVLIDCDKSKFGNKFKEFAYAIGHLSRMPLTRDEKRKALEERMYAYDKEVLRRRR